MQSQSQQGSSSSMNANQAGNNKKRYRSAAQQPVHSADGPTSERELQQAWDEVHQCLITALYISKMGVTVETKAFMLFEQYIQKYGLSFEMHAKVWLEEVKSRQEEFSLMNDIYNTRMQRVQQEYRLAMMKIMYESRLKAEETVRNKLKLNATSTSHKQF